VSYKRKQRAEGDGYFEKRDSMRRTQTLIIFMEPIVM